ncbi:WG repeat-containing protein [Flaviaesturariibacter amylovorans]|uniref:WG repeat-containing protein n=1 Tax=Flaviaesturariibacter amylovorans TaxID=1084520 RepID=A0ABP8G724_9BACT
MLLYPWYDKETDSYGYRDEAGTLVVAPRYEEAEPFSGGIASVRTETGAGVIDARGSELLPPRYQHAFVDRGWVHAYEQEDSAQLLFDAAGTLRLRLEGIQYLYPPEDGLVRVKRQGRWGVLDLDGLERIPFVHRSLGPAWQGRLPYYDDGGWGWVDSAGAILVPGQFTAVGPWDDACWWGRKKGGLFEVFDRNNERISPFDLLELNARRGPASLVRSSRGLHFFGPGFTHLLDLPAAYDLAANFYDGRALVQRGGKFGFLDAAGNEVIGAGYVAAGSFSEGLAPVLAGGRWGYIDTNGKETIAPQFAKAGLFSERLAPVQQQGNWGYIDREGTIQIPCAYSEAGSFRQGLATVGDGRYEWRINRKGAPMTKPVDLWD